LQQGRIGGLFCIGSAPYLGSRIAVSPAPTISPSAAGQPAITSGIE
jgi:hypothetical protein